MGARSVRSERPDHHLAANAETTRFAEDATLRFPDRNPPRTPAIAIPASYPPDLSRPSMRALRTASCAWRSRDRRIAIGGAG
jgi:hypothetical protein